MRLHHILQDYKHTEQHRSTLENKLTVIKHHYDSNRKKAKNIQSSILKIQDIKHHYRREKQEVTPYPIQIAHLLSQEKENQNRKIAREREKRENNRENITIIHNMIIQEKQKDYFKIKDSEQTNQLRITQNLKTSLHEKRQKSLEVKLKEEESKLAKTIFLEKKRLRAQRDIENEMAPLELGKSMN